MATLTSAVGGDTFGGLSGYKRPVSGNPTRVPSNLPAFRGTTNTPGQAIGVPKITSSKNRNDRGTNILVPYSRITHYDEREFGGKLPGDLAFLSAYAPNTLPFNSEVGEGGPAGNGIYQYSRLLGLYALNTTLAELSALNRYNEYANVMLLKEGDTDMKILDEWHTVPTLKEYRLDGVVLSDDQPGVKHGSSKNDLGQLFNIAVQGPTAINNGYVTERGHTMLSRPEPTFSKMPLDVQIDEARDEVELMGDRSSRLYGLPNEYTYSEQMFSRDIEPQDELFVALIATKFDVEGAESTILRTHDELRNAVLDAKTVQDLAEARQELREFIQGEGQDLRKLLQGRSAIRQLDASKTEYGVSRPLDTETKAVVAFQYWLCTSATLVKLNNKSGLNRAMARNERPEDVNFVTDKRKTVDTYEAKCDEEWLKRMVGAWRVGTVLDTKATAMPYFEGGPVETGNRLKVNVCVEWMGWRELRRKYTNNPEGPQVGEKYKSGWAAMVQSSVPSVGLARIGGGYVGEETFDETWDNADGVGADGKPIGEGIDKDDEIVTFWPVDYKKEETRVPRKRKRDPDAAKPPATPPDDASEPPVAAIEPPAAATEPPAEKPVTKPSEESDRAARKRLFRERIDKKYETFIRSVSDKKLQRKYRAERREWVDKLVKQANNEKLYFNVDFDPKKTIANLLAKHPERGREILDEVQEKALQKALKNGTELVPIESSLESTMDYSDDSEDEEGLGAATVMETSSNTEKEPSTPAKKSFSAMSTGVVGSSVARAKERALEKEKPSPSRSPQPSPTASSANKFARRRSPASSPNHPIDTATSLEDATMTEISNTAADASSPAGPSSVDASAAEHEEVPKSKKPRARPTSDVLSSIFGGSGDATRLELPSNKVSKEKFSRRRRGGS